MCKNRLFSSVDPVFCRNIIFHEYMGQVRILLYHGSNGVGFAVVVLTFSLILGIVASFLFYHLLEYTLYIFSFKID